MSGVNVLSNAKLQTVSLRCLFFDSGKSECQSNNINNYRLKEPQQQYGFLVQLALQEEFEKIERIRFEIVY